MAKFSKTMNCHVKISGLLPLMFDRYAGDNKTQLAPQDKLYLDREAVREDGGIPIVFPALNISSFLSATNTTSAPKMVFDPRTYKRVGMALASSIVIQSRQIQITRDGEPICFYGFNDDLVDIVSGVHVERHVARVKGGIPNPKERPVLDTPWDLEWDMLVLPHPDLSSDILEQVFRVGGLAVGFGTFRPFYGKFELVSMEFSAKDLK